MEKAIINSLISKGLYNSSIKGAQQKASEESKLSELEGLRSELDKKIGDYDAQIEKLKGEEKRRSRTVGFVVRAKSSERNKIFAGKAR